MPLLAQFVGGLVLLSVQALLLLMLLLLGSQVLLEHVVVIAVASQAEGGPGIVTCCQGTVEAQTIELMQAGGK